MVFVLVLTGHSLAIARGMPGASGYAEYCIGETAVMVPVDAEGNPIGPAHVCPDISLSLLNWIAESPLVIVPVTGAVSRESTQRHRDAPAIRRKLPSTRAPPILL